jgi:hypothetical protein
MARTPKNAPLQSREELQELIKNDGTKLVLSNGRVINIRPMCADTQDKIDDLIVEHDKIAAKVKANEMTEQEGNRYTRMFYSKCAAAIILNGYFKLKLFYGLKWRIIHKFWNLTGKDYLSIISEAKKKGHQQEYYLAMALAMTMNDTCTMMTKKEAEAFQQELNSVKEQQR